MITPTVGRVVWYRPSEHDRLAMTVYGDQPMKADVAFVFSDTCVNLSVTDHNGNTHARTSVTLHQAEGPCASSPYCEWMPFQKGQAQKTEAIEKQLATRGA